MFKQFTCFTAFRLIFLCRIEHIHLEGPSSKFVKMASQVSSVDTASTNTLIKIVCLHGYGQNGNIFKEKLGGFRRLFKNRAKFFFLDAPLVIDKENDTNERAWFSKTSDGNRNLKGFEESVKYFADYYAENGPFDGLLGFSQGAQLAAILCTSPIYKFKFVILIAGCKISNPDHSVYFENEIKIPSLHVIGESDTIIKKERSEELRACFCPHLRETLVHEGGHYVPVNKNVKDKYISFIEKYFNYEPDDYQ